MVLAWAFGVDVSSATVVPDEDYLGQVRTGSIDEEAFHTGPVDGTAEYELVRAHAVIMMGGKVADELHLGRSVDWTDDAYDVDLRIFEVLASQLGWGIPDEGFHSEDFLPARDEAEADARELIRERWAAVRAVADAAVVVCGGP